jgi:hypothetical protein
MLVQSAAVSLLVELSQPPLPNQCLLLLYMLLCRCLSLFLAIIAAVQHLWTGPISNAPVEIIQGGRSVEVRPVGVTKGLAMQRILGYMAHIMGRQVCVIVILETYV